MSGELYRDEGVVLRTYKLAESDRIVVMEDGRVVETGSHRDLTVAGGRYRSHYALQFADLPNAGTA